MKSVLAAVAVLLALASSAPAATSVTELRALAEKGDPRAQYNLALYYDEGSHGLSRDPAEAVVWYRKASEQGLAQAQNNLGTMYELGSGVPQDYQAAVGWYRKAAVQGWRSPSTTSGSRITADAESSRTIKRPWNGTGRRPSRALGAAQQLLGAMYDVGKGTDRNSQEAVHWYRQAAEQGDAIAQYVLGVMYQTGDGVPQDYVKAYAWLDLAAKQDLEQAKRSRDAAAAAMNGAQLAEAQRLSNQLRLAERRAADFRASAKT
jgi:TPR repeat protein